MVGRETSLEKKQNDKCLRPFLAGRIFFKFSFFSFKKFFCFCFFFYFCGTFPSVIILPFLSLDNTRLNSDVHYMAVFQGYFKLKLNFTLALFLVNLKHYGFNSSAHYICLQLKRQTMARCLCLHFLFLYLSFFLILLVRRSFFRARRKLSISA